MDMWRGVNWYWSLAWCSGPHWRMRRFSCWTSTPLCVARAYL